MRYVFTDSGFDSGCDLWKTLVFEEAKKAPGLIRMQLLSAKPMALAIGTWEDKKYAESFMRTGVFKKLKESLVGKLTAEPVSEHWTLDSVWEKA
ncbi:MAG TPA: hypothetical protein GXZ47_01590 [Treponema sp.]|nr:hypothetical protein [Treponema sp.]